MIALDTDKMRTISEMRRDLSVILARGVCKNVSRIDVDGEYVLIRDILGEEIRLQGKIKMVDLANSIVELDCE